MTGKVSCIFFPPIRKRKSLSRQLSSRRKVMLGKSSHRMLSTTLVLLVFGALLGAAWAQKESVLYSFCAQTSCADGANPMAGLVFDQKGNLYGTTSAGGSGIHGQWGAVFKLAPEGKYTVLYSFCE